MFSLMDGPSTPPDPGSHEQAILGGLFYMESPDIIRNIATRLRSDHFKYPLHRSIYKAIIAVAKRNDPDNRGFPPFIYDVMDRLTGSTTEEGYQGVIRGNLATMLTQRGPLSEDEMDTCILFVKECAGKRARFDAATKILKMCCSVEMSVDVLDQNIDLLWKAARKP